VPCLRLWIGAGSPRLCRLATRVVAGLTSRDRRLNDTESHGARDVLR
jgi:hypothetical protein